MESEQISFDTIVKTEAEQLRDAVQGSISDKEQYGKFIEVCWCSLQGGMYGGRGCDSGSEWRNNRFLTWIL